MDNRGIVEIASKVTNDLGLPLGTGLFVVRHLIANKIWLIDMHKSIQPDTRMEILERTIPTNN